MSFYETILAFLPVIIDITGIVILFLLALLSSYFTSLFPIYKKKMRLLYGYIAVTFTLLSLIFYLYLEKPFENHSTTTLFLSFNPLAGVFYIITTAILSITIFHTIVEIEFQEDGDCNEFVILLAIQAVVYFLFFASNWIVFFFGMSFVITLINIYLHALFENQAEKPLSYLTNYLIFNSIALGMLFMGIASIYYVHGTFQFSPSNELLAHAFWEILGTTLVITSSFLLIGNVPYYHWMQSYVNYKMGSLSLIITVFQRILGFAILTYALPLFNSSNVSIVIGWILLSIGILSFFYSTFSSITENMLSKLVFYFNMGFTGLFLLVVGQYILTSDQKVKQSLGTIIAYYLFIYVLIFAFAICSHMFVFKRYNTDDFTKLRGLGRKDVFRFLSFLFVLLFLLVFPFSGGFFFYYFAVKAFSLQGTLYLFLILILGFIWSTVSFVRYIRYVFIEPPSKDITLRTYNVEMGLSIAMIVSFLVLLSLTFLIENFLEFCKLISDFI